MAGYLIAVAAFALPCALGALRLGRPRMVLIIGGVAAVGWVVSLSVNRASDANGDDAVPLWFLAGLVLLLYAIWCGGLWLGLRLRRMRRAIPG
jgi:lipopolysaccharide export LptBFGC system permease protein LptF